MAQEEVRKVRPEVAVAREYFTLTYHAWALRHNGCRKWGMTEKAVDEELKALEAPILKARQEGQERFVDPQQKNKHELNRNIGFQDWYLGWNDFFYKMPKEDYDKFANLEKQYYEQGSCAEYEQIQCPKQFKRKVMDLTAEECTELEKVINDTKQFVELLSKYREKHNKVGKKEVSTKGVKSKLTTVAKNLKFAKKLTAYIILSDDCGDTHGVDKRYDKIGTKYGQCLITNQVLLEQLLQSEGLVKAKSSYGGGFQTWRFEDSEDLYGWNDEFITVDKSVLTILDTKEDLARFQTNNYRTKEE